MKLSEILSKPLELRGGGVLDLRGFVKVVKNKDVAMEPIQADWNQTDNTKLDYIKNKPEIKSAVFIDGSFSEFTCEGGEINVYGEDVQTLLNALSNDIPVYINIDAMTRQIPVTYNDGRPYAMVPYSFGLNPRQIKVFDIILHC